MNPTDKRPRTFSLARLMAGVTMICVACGIGVQFPGPSLVTLGLILYFLPTIVAFMVLACFTQERIGLIVLVLMGAFVGVFVGFSLAVGLHPRPRGILGEFVGFVALVWAPPAIGALVFAGPVVYGARRLRSRDDREA